MLRQVIQIIAVCTVCDWKHVYVRGVRLAFSLSGEKEPTSTRQYLSVWLCNFETQFSTPQSFVCLLLACLLVLFFSARHSYSDSVAFEHKIHFFSVDDTVYPQDFPLFFVHRRMVWNVCLQRCRSEFYWNNTSVLVASSHGSAKQNPDEWKCWCDAMSSFTMTLLF